MEKAKYTIENTEGGNSSAESKRNCRHFASLQTVATIPEIDTPECEIKFRRALRNVPSKTYIRNREGKLIIYLRPENLLEFGASVNRQGLEQCEATRKILRYLDKHQSEFLKFEHPTKN